VVKAQSVSNEGTDFWAVFPTHIPAGTNTGVVLAEMFIYITGTKSSSGTVSVGSLVIPFSVTANQIVQVPIPYSAANITYGESNKVVSGKSIHIEVANGQPKVAVFALISARARSEAYLVLPTDVMGQRYYAMSEVSTYLPNDNGVTGKPYILVVATQDNTNITLKNARNGINTTIHLDKKGDMYEFLDDRDVTGTLIETDDCNKRFAAFSGHSGLGIDGTSADPLAQQLYPTESWGKTYGVVPFIDRKYYYRMIAAENDTKVFIDGVEVATLAAGEIYDAPSRPLTKPFLITANRPVSVAQFAYSQSVLSATSNPVLGDPDMVILNPEEYSIKQITLFASLGRTTEFYLNIFMKTTGTSTFKINGSSSGVTWTVMETNPLYSYAQIPYSGGLSLTLSADEGFNAMAYGFGATESYAYSAGTNLAVNNFLKLTNLNAGITGDNACSGAPLELKVTLPSPATSLTWTFEDTKYNRSDPNPVPFIPPSTDGIVRYEYEYKGEVIYSSPGPQQIVLHVQLAPGSNPCNLTEIDYSYNFEIVKPEIVLPDQVEILEGGTTNIKGTTTEVDLTYKWSPQTGISDPNIINPNVTNTHDQLYTLTATSSLGCVTTASVLVKIVDGFDIPNSFSPNGDGVNDVWNLKLLNTYLNSLVEIFNRNGAKVFSNVGYGTPFDGNYQGQPLPVGTYYYVITPRNGKQSKSGPLTIIR